MLPDQSLPQFRNVAPAELPDHLRNSAQRINSTRLARTIPNLQPTQRPRRKAPPNKSVLLFPSDKNGCGFYRTMIPFNYLTAKHEFDATTLYAFVFDMNFIARTKWLRFQRQVTNAQLRVIKEYKKVIRQTKSSAKIAYEIDDLVHEIEMSNIIAYQFYTKTRRDNLIEIMKMSDTVTVSTEFLKDYYEEKFNIDNIVVIPNFLPKFLWADKGKRDKRAAGKKPRVLWAGSASHVGKGGDLEFLIPLIKKTKDEFEWVFFGVMPPELDGMGLEFHSWADFWSYPAALDAIDADVALCPIKDTVFNYAKSDLKVLEYSALNMPSICSSIGEGMGPYDMHEGICAVENNSDDWYQAIKAVVTDDAVHQNFLDVGRNILEERWLENDNNIQHYLDVYGETE